MRKFKYVGPFDEIVIPALGATVARHGLVEVDDTAIGDEFEARDDFEHVVDKKRSEAAKKAAAKTTAEPDTAPADTTKEG